MSPVPPPIRDFARRLIALEAARHERAADGSGAERVCGKLRAPLAKLVGAIGFRSLLARALVLTKAEVPSLGGVQVQPDGAVEWFDGVADPAAGEILVTHLLGLLVILIGEPLTVRLVSDAWPEAAITSMGAGSGEGL